MSTLPKRGRAGSSNAGPAQTVCPGKTSSEYIECGQTASVTEFPKDRVSRRRFASVRIKELYTLALYRRREGFVVNATTFADALAFHLACDQPGRIVEPGTGDRGKAKVVPWTGLTLETLRRAIVSAELGYMEDEELLSAIVGVQRWREKNGPSLSTASKLGRDLQLTAIEREACRITTIEAVDESKADRLARLREAKLIRDRERQRTVKTRKQRAIYEAESLSKTKPWEAFGIGRRQWERRGKPDVASISPTIESQSARDLRHGQEVEELGALPFFLQNEKILMQIMCPEESHPVPEYVFGKGDVADLIDRAAKILKAQRTKGPRFYNDPLEETLALLGGLAMIARHDRQGSSEISTFNLKVAATESAKLIQARAANDNRLAEIARRLSA